MHPSIVAWLFVKCGENGMNFTIHGGICNKKLFRVILYYDFFGNKTT